MANDDKFKKVISHAKEYGYVFQSSEIYDGLSAVYDYAQNGFSESVSLSAFGLPSGANAVFSPSSISTSGNVVMTISGLDAEMPQNYTINIKGDATTVNQNLDVAFNLT